MTGQKHQAESSRQRNRLMRQYITDITSALGPDVAGWFHPRYPPKSVDPKKLSLDVLKWTARLAKVAKNHMDIAFKIMASAAAERIEAKGGQRRIKSVDIMNTYYRMFPWTNIPQGLALEEVDSSSDASSDTDESEFEALTLKDKMDYLSSIWSGKDIIPNPFALPWEAKYIDPTGLRQGSEIVSVLVGAARRTGGVHKNVLNMSITEAAQHRVEMDYEGYEHKEVTLGDVTKAADIYVKWVARNTAPASTPQPVPTGPDRSSIKQFVDEARRNSRNRTGAANGHPELGPTISLPEMLERRVGRSPSTGWFLTVTWENSNDTHKLRNFSEKREGIVSIENRWGACLAEIGSLDTLMPEEALCLTHGLVVELDKASKLATEANMSLEAFSRMLWTEVNSRQSRYKTRQTLIVSDVVEVQHKIKQMPRPASATTHGHIPPAPPPSSRPWQGRPASSLAPREAYPLPPSSPVEQSPPTSQPSPAFPPSSKKHGRSVSSAAMENPHQKMGRQGSISDSPENVQQPLRSADPAMQKLLDEKDAEIAALKKDKKELKEKNMELKRKMKKTAEDLSRSSDD